MERTGIIGYGATPFRARWKERTYYELAFMAMEGALSDSGMDKGDIDAVVYGIYNEFFQRQIMPDVYIHTHLGLAPLPSYRVTTGGATGGAAVMAGFSLVASGIYDVVMVMGVEKCADCYNYSIGSSTPEILRAILYSADMTFENPLGLTAAASYAIPTVAHIESYGNPTPLQMAHVSVKNHENAFLNPVAQSPKRLKIEDVLNSRMIAWPFRFYDNCLYSEGAACIILASEKKIRDMVRRGAWITGVGSSLDIAYIGEREDKTTFPSTELAGRDAFRMAGIKDPSREIDFAELHDAFTSVEIISMEALGLVGKGEAGPLVEEGYTRKEGGLPVNVSGGLIGCGHAVGATGVMQTGEAFLQVTGRAERRQIEGARRGIVQSIGGPACAWSVAIIVEGEKG